MLNHDEAFTDLLALLNATDEVVFGVVLVNKWSDTVLDTFLTLGVVDSYSVAQVIECDGCENACFMDVVTICHNDKTRAFIVCEDELKQAEMGRINIPLENLEQWRFGINNLTKLLCYKLGLDCTKTKFLSDSKIVEIGMLKRQSNRRYVYLKPDPWSIEINKHRLAIEEVLNFENDDLCINDTDIEAFLESKLINSLDSTSKKISKNEDRKSQTRLKHQSWKDEYAKLKHKKPHMSDTSIANLISKLPIADGKAIGTIRKNMK